MPELSNPFATKSRPGTAVHHYEQVGNDVEIDDDDDSLDAHNSNFVGERHRNVMLRSGYYRSQFAEYKKLWVLLFFVILTGALVLIGRNESGLGRDELKVEEENDDGVSLSGGLNQEDKNISNPLLNPLEEHEIPNDAIEQNDPFNVLRNPTWYGGVFVPQPFVGFWQSDHENEDDNVIGGLNSDNIGYIQYPNVHNNTLVFCTEGDVFLSSISDILTNADDVISKDDIIIPAMRLTATEGNANTPHINPHYPYLVAFTATYSGKREAYLIDLRPQYRSQPSMRLTYMDSSISGIVGWENEGETLVVRAYSMDISLVDERLYKIGILQHEKKAKKKNNNEKSKLSLSVTVANISPVPLSQAIDSIVDPASGCRYFTRYRQSSKTIRYVGGTAENLWAYCPDNKLAVPLTNDYNGTSKSPQIYSTTINNNDEIKLLLFLSDRARSGNEWKSSTMNLWGMVLPTEKELYATEVDTMKGVGIPFQLTSVSCDFNGIPLQEYTIDSVSGYIILRIGADLFMIEKKKFEKKTRMMLNIVNMDEDQSKTVIKVDTLSTTRAKDEESNIISLPISVYSDFNNMHERIIPLINPWDISTIDVYKTEYGSISALMTGRGQLFVNPVIHDKKSLKKYDGGGMNIPPRRYKVAPGSVTGGMIRILGAWHVPQPKDENQKQITKIAHISIVLATDPLSATAEMAFYFLDTSAGSPTDFTDMKNLTKPYVGGNLGGGAVSEGGLGSVNVQSVRVSPCGRRVAWTDTDGRIAVMSITAQDKLKNDQANIKILPQVNTNGEPMTGTEADLTWSPAGRYLAIEHAARNQFAVISIADLGDPNESIVINQIIQATPDRFNSMSPYWGCTSADFADEHFNPSPTGSLPMATTLYFLTDRDIVLSGVSSPWGTRAPSPHFSKKVHVFALPLIATKDVEFFPGDGAAELMPSNRIDTNDENHTLTSSSSEEDLPIVTNSSNISSYAIDIPISFGLSDDYLSFARQAYLISNIPPSYYFSIIQLKDSASLLLVQASGLVFFSFDTFPSDIIHKVDLSTLILKFEDIGVSTSRDYLYLTYSGITKIILNTNSGISLLRLDLEKFDLDVVDTDDWSVSVWPKLEYQQIYGDAWRMLRDYYYDPGMGMVDWPSIHARYKPLVSRCGKREELDDVLAQMSSELSALHVFVYGGEYNDPMHGNILASKLNEVASLGAVLERSVKWNGYIIDEVPQPDPDFNPLDGIPIYSPLSEMTLKKSGQYGLQKGDVIVGVNGESVMSVPDIHMMFRGMAGRSIRLDVLRLQSKSLFLSGKGQPHSSNKGDVSRKPESLIVVPITPAEAENVRYAAWEWKTRESAKRMAKEAGFSVGYIHLRTMDGSQAEDSFVRGFFPDYDKDALIVDVRHNRGGNIDSWLLNTLQRKAWTYWQGRTTNITNGGLGWDEQFAFRGRIIVLIDEKTSSDGEGKSDFN